MRGIRGTIASVCDTRRAWPSVPRSGTVAARWSGRSGSRGSARRWSSARSSPASRTAVRAMRPTRRRGPFLLVAGLLLLGLVADRDGVFEFASARLLGVTTHPRRLLLLALALVALVTAVLNLDTAVVFLTPILIGAARGSGSGEEAFLYGSVLMANASSLLLPGANLTNLLVLAGEPVSGATFVARVLPAALVVGGGHGGGAGASSRRAAPRGTAATRPTAEPARAAAPAPARRSASSPARSPPSWCSRCRTRGSRSWRSASRRRSRGACSRRRGDRGRRPGRARRAVRALGPARAPGPRLVGPRGPARRGVGVGDDRDRRGLLGPRQQPPGRGPALGLARRRTRARCCSASTSGRTSRSPARCRATCGSRPPARPARSPARGGSRSIGAPLAVIAMVAGLATIALLGRS